MTPFTWIQIDKVRYEWDGDELIHCRTAVGYQNALPGHQLLGLEIEGQDGELAGELRVDFPGGVVQFVPAEGVSAPDDLFIELGDAGSALRLPLSDVALHAGALDYLDWGALAPEPDLWSLLIGADDSLLPQAQMPLSLDDLLYDADVSPPLDELFVQQDDMARGHVPLPLDAVGPVPNIEWPDILPPGLDV